MASPEPCELSTVVSELDQVLAAERTKMLGLPPPRWPACELSFEVRFPKTNRIAQFLRHFALRDRSTQIVTTHRPVC